jgi:hypothetical protein
VFVAGLVAAAGANVRRLGHGMEHWIEHKIDLATQNSTAALIEALRPKLDALHVRLPLTGRCVVAAAAG